MSVNREQCSKNAYYIEYDEQVWYNMLFENIIYIYIYVCVCVCVCAGKITWLSVRAKIRNDYEGDNWISAGLLTKQMTNNG